MPLACVARRLGQAAVLVLSLPMGAIFDGTTSSLASSSCCIAHAVFNCAFKIILNIWLSIKTEKPPKNAEIALLPVIYAQYGMGT